MTRNEISYQQSVETKRSNLTQEAETQRSNMAREAEQKRQTDELIRSNKAREAEAARWNDMLHSYNMANLAEQKAYHLMTNSMNDLISQRSTEASRYTAELHSAASRYAALMNSSATRYAAATNASTQRYVSAINANVALREMESREKIATDKNANDYLIAGLRESTSSANAIMANETARYEIDKRYSGVLNSQYVNSLSNIIAKLIG